LVDVGCQVVVSGPPRRPANDTRTYNPMTRHPARPPPSPPLARQHALSHRRGGREGGAVSFEAWLPVLVSFVGRRFFFAPWPDPGPRLCPPPWCPNRSCSRTRMFVDKNQKRHLISRVSARRVRIRAPFPAARNAKCSVFRLALVSLGVMLQGCHLECTRNHHHKQPLCLGI
jgi:hypothetical protein